MKKEVKIKEFGLEFKKFISKGNIIDLAVGVVIGGAFGKIVTSLVNDIIMPLIGIIIGGIDFNNLALRIGNVTINYGIFIQNIVDFLIISFCIFIFLRILLKLNKKEEVKEEKKATDEKLEVLREIRDLLKNKDE